MDSRILPMYHRDSHCLPLASAPSLLETHSNSDGSCSYIYLYHNSLHFSSQRLTPLIRPAHLRLASQLPLPPRIFFVLLFFVAHRKLCGVWEAVAKLAWSLKKAGWSEAVAVFPTAASITSKDLNNIVLLQYLHLFAPSFFRIRAIHSSCASSHQTSLPINRLCGIAALWLFLRFAQRAWKRTIGSDFFYYYARLLGSYKRRINQWLSRRFFHSLMIFIKWKVISSKPTSNFAVLNLIEIENLMFAYIINVLYNIAASSLFI